MKKNSKSKAKRSARSTDVVWGRVRPVLMAAAVKRARKALGRAPTVSETVSIAVAQYANGGAR